MPSDWRQATYYHYHGDYGIPPQIGVRTQTHKLIYFPTFKHGKAPYWELFDLRTDPQELRNIYGDPKQGPVVDKLKQQLQTLVERYGEVGFLEEVSKCRQEKQAPSL